MTLLICADPAWAAEVEALARSELPLDAIHTITHYPDAAALGAALERHRSTLCLLDVATDAESAFRVLSDLQSAGTAIPVVALLGPDGSDLVLRCLRQGAADFLLRPLTADQVRAVLERLPACGGGGGAASSARVFCIIPAQGGCGATTVASNLACQLGKLGTAKKVLLADLDPLAGTIAFLWKLKTSYSFVDVLNHGSALDADIWKGVVVPSHGIDVLLAPERPVHAIDQGAGPAEIIRFARQSYDYIVLDAPNAYGEWALQLAHSSDHILLVTTTEQQSIYGARRALAYLDRNRVSRSKIQVAVNRHRTDLGLRREEIEEILAAKVRYVLPNDYDGIHRALVDGKAAAGCSFSKQLAALAAKIGAGDTAEEPEPRPAAKSGGISSLFSLFGRRKG
jgi:pilus assembly protein CpaE